MQHFLTASDNIIRSMLAVSVHSNHADTIRLAKAVLKGSFQCPALSLIYFMNKQRALGIFHCPFKPYFAFGFASVVHQDNRFKAGFHQALNHPKEFFIGIQRRNDCGYVHMQSLFLRPKPEYINK
jgi:hypothetical protein